MAHQDSKIDLSIVIPCFRGEKTLRRLCERIESVCSDAHLSHEIILVDDSGRSELWVEIESLVREFPRVSALRLSRNFGQHNATVTGFRHSNGEYVVSLDEDLQNPPEEIPGMLEHAKSTSLDIVYGIPKKRSGPLWRSFASKLVMAIPRSVMGIDFDISAFRLIRGQIARKVAETDRHDIILDIYLSWFTQKIGSIEVGHDNSDLKSSYSLRKLVTLLVDLCCNYTVFPLRVIAVVGFVISLISIIAAGAILVAYMQNYLTVPGWASITFSILFSTGAILMALGVVAEYLARVFLRINGKPQSFVSTSLIRKAHSKDVVEISKRTASLD